MGIKLKLNLAFQELIGSKDNIEVDGNTVKECLDDFIKRFPPAKDWLFDEKGFLQSLVLMNEETISQEQLDRPVTVHDKLWILNILEGG